MIKYLIAMEREAEKFRKLKIPDGEIYIIGIGATNLPQTTDEDILVNIGYAGGYKVPKGTVVEPKFVIDAKAMHVRNIHNRFNIETARCYSCDEFVNEPFTKYIPSIYDMELYKIASLPRKKLYSLKIVSDSLNESECEAYNEDKPWEEVEKLLNTLIDKE